jgi:tetratricopeptide (TPR) repeat protein
LRLGFTYYKVYKNLSIATVEIQRAIELWGKNSNPGWPFQVLGEIYEIEGDWEQAKLAYEEAIRLNPADMETVEKLNLLLAQREQKN